MHFEDPLCKEESESYSFVFFCFLVTDPYTSHHLPRSYGPPPKTLGIQPNIRLKTSVSLFYFRCLELGISPKKNQKTIRETPLPALGDFLDGMLVTFPDALMGRTVRIFIYMETIILYIFLTYNFTTFSYWYINLHFTKKYMVYIYISVNLPAPLEHMTSGHPFRHR